MKKLILAALMIGAASLATGCIISSDDDGDDDDDDDDIVADGVLDLTWNLTSGREDLEPGTCPPGSSIELVGITEPTDVWDCEDLGGQTAPLPSGSYDVYLRIYDGAVTYAQSYLIPGVVVTDGETTPLSFDIAVDGGYFGLNWTINGDRPDAAACAAVPSPDFPGGAGGVGVIATLVNSGGQTATDDQFDCDAGEGTTLKIATGDYTVQVDLFDTDEEPGFLGQAEPRDATIEFGNQLVDLGVFDFTFDQ